MELEGFLRRSSWSVTYSGYAYDDARRAEDGHLVLPRYPNARGPSLCQSGRCGPALQESDLKETTHLSLNTFQ